jgi:uncharacterized membrane protein
MLPFIALLTTPGLLVLPPSRVSHVGAQTAALRRSPQPLMGRWVDLGSSETPVDAPAAFAYSVLSDYPRWPEWSPWLSRVEVWDDLGVTHSKWFLSIQGIDVSCAQAQPSLPARARPPRATPDLTTYRGDASGTSENVEEVTGSMVRWESTSGVQNGGTVAIEPTGDTSCAVTISLRYEIPTLVSRLFSTRFVSRFVSQRLAADLRRFSTLAEHEYAMQTGS